MNVTNIENTKTIPEIIQNSATTFSLIYKRTKQIADSVNLYYVYSVTGDESVIRLSFSGKDKKISTDIRFKYKMLDPDDNVVDYIINIPKAISNGRIPLSFSQNEETIVVDVEFVGGSEGNIGEISFAMKEDYDDRSY